MNETKKPFKLEDIGMPSFGPASEGIDHSKYAIKILKVNLDDPSEKTDLEIITTKSISGKGEIIIVERDKFTFMDKYFMIVTYLELKAT